MSARGRRVLLLGGTSEIGLAIVRELACKGGLEAMLMGREEAALERAATDLRRSGCGRVATLSALDASDLPRHEQLLDRAFEELGGVDVAILAVGVLGERGGLPEDLNTALQVLQVNTCGAASLLIATLTRMRAEGGGAMIVLSSVAAQRPRRANAVYGASKAGIDSLAQALSDELKPQGVDVIVVRPGFVHTRMTRGLARPPLACEPQDVARAAISGLERGATTVWAPRAMRWVMLAIGLLPRSIFRRLSL